MPGVVSIQAIGKAYHVWWLRYKPNDVRHNGLDINNLYRSYKPSHVRHVVNVESWRAQDKTDAARAVSRLSGVSQRHL